MSVVSTEHPGPDAVAEPASTGTLPSMLVRARQFARKHEQPMLALRAYSAWMRAATVDTRTRHSALLYFTMYCNKFALEEKCAGGPNSALCLARVNDYFRLVLDQFDAVLSLQVEVPNVAEATNVSSAWAITIPPQPIPPALLTALQITLHNWACLQLGEGDEGLRMADQLLALSRQVGEQTQGCVNIGWTWEAVCAVNATSRLVAKCQFAEAEVEARKAVDLVVAADTEADDMLASGADGDRGSSFVGAELLSALCYFALGLATENTACETALQFYDEALGHARQSHAAAQHRAAMEQVREQLSQYIEGARSDERARAVAEDVARVTSADRKGLGTARSKRGQGAARRAPRKASGSRASFGGQGAPSVAAPPIPAALHKYLSEHGLATLVCSVCSFDAVLRALARSLPGHGVDEEPLLSVFANTRFAAVGATPVFAVLLCTSTPLQWTLRLQEAAQQPAAAVHRSVWSPQPSLAPLLAELSASRPPGPKSASASQTRKEIVEGNGRLRQQVLQLFAPPAATAKAKQSAHESVDAVVQLLGQRLAVLLKTERAFEDHWSATERVLAALRSYSVLKDIVEFKRNLMRQRRLRDMRRERCARTIVRFFRNVVLQRTRREALAAAQQQRIAERERAAVVFQKYGRRWLAYRERRWRAKARADYISKVVIVQSLVRGRRARAAHAAAVAALGVEAQVRAASAALSYAAMQIQRVYRGHCARLRCYHLRGLPHEAILHHLSDSRNYFATLIQKRARGMLVRRRYGEAVYAKRCYGRNVYRTQLWERSCIVIQRAFRAARARRAYVLATSSPLEHAATGSAAARRLILHGAHGAAAHVAEDQEAAAQRIQDAYRTSVAKRRLEALKYARAKEREARGTAGIAEAAPFSLEHCLF